MSVRLWGALAVVLVALGGVSWWLSSQQNAPERVDLNLPKNLDDVANPKRPKLKTATLQPGRVVVLNTDKGKIEFVLFEKDCPKTTARITQLVQSGAYDGVEFKRAENWVIQTNPANRLEEGMGIEVAKGLLFGEGSVGMARAQDLNSNTSEFFITLEPAHHLDLSYTDFGQVISGMDVVRKIAVGDKIRSATLRHAGDGDRRRLAAVLGSDTAPKPQPTTAK